MDSSTNKAVYVFTANDFYSGLEKRYSSPHHRKCINGRITGCGNTVGYCRFSEHPGYLTKELRKDHNCIKKGCYYYAPKRHGTAPSPHSSPFDILAEAFGQTI